MFARLFFAALTAAAGILVALSMVPPTPLNPKNASIDDRIRLPFIFHGLAITRTGLAGLSIIQAFHVATSSKPTKSLVLTPNAISVPTLLVITIASIARLYVFSALGKDFTFDLRNPSALKTDGVYSWVQHPSYTTGIASFVGGMIWFSRLDGVISSVLPQWLLKRQAQIHAFSVVASIVVTIIFMTVRIGDEERLLRRQFGKQWEEWHARTPRLLPYLF